MTPRDIVFGVEMVYGVDPRDRSRRRDVVVARRAAVCVMVLADIHISKIERCLRLANSSVVYLRDNPKNILADARIDEVIEYAWIRATYRETRRQKKRDHFLEVAS